MSLPFFPGFYDSLLYNPDTEYYAIQSELDYYRDDLGRDDLTDDDFDFDYAGYERTVCENFCDAWKRYAPAFVKSVTFKELDRPREYNFRNDYLIAEVELSDDWEKAMTAFMNENAEWLKERINEEWSSRDGFISFMSNKLYEWPGYLFGEKDDRYISSMIKYMMELSWENVEDWIVDDTLEYTYMSEYISLKPEVLATVA